MACKDEDAGSGEGDAAAVVRPRGGLDELKVMKIVEFDNDCDYKDAAMPLLLLQQQQQGMLILSFFFSLLFFLFFPFFFLDLLPFLNLTNKEVGGFFFVQDLGSQM